MKHIAALLALVFVSGCEASRPSGDCIGVNDVEVAGVEYEYSTRNVLLAVFFVETIVVPAVVVLADLKCPKED